ncbi:MAG TPA: hypothetical protein VM580_27405 [Labilithrix sp.]|nr:hypothetical protein [Labilithrix sp.]
MMSATPLARKVSQDGGDAPEKRSLAAILRDHGPLSVADAVDITLDLCDELANVHANGIVHGGLGLNRVRVFWPRVPGRRVDIFKLEDDSAALALRASSAGAILVAPEQREGRAVDHRADIWAVGAILHWLIAGAPLGSERVPGTLAKLPRALSATLETCLADDPQRRPQSVDAIAEALGSFASSPPERFEQLAQRRVLVDDASCVRSDLPDVERVLGRLDDAALEREVLAASESQAQAALSERAAERLAFHSNANRTSAVFAKAAPSLSRLDEREAPDATSLSDLVDDQQDIETVVCSPPYMAGGSVSQAAPAPAAGTPSIAPVVLSPAAAAPPTPQFYRPAPTPSPQRARKLNPWMMAGVLAGALVSMALSVGLGVGAAGVGVRTLERVAARRLPSSPVAPVQATVELLTPSPAEDVGGEVIELPSSPEVTAPEPEAPSSAGTDEGAAPVSPSSLPDAKR